MKAVLLATTLLAFAALVAPVASADVVVSEEAPAPIVPTLPGLPVVVTEAKPVEVSLGGQGAGDLALTLRGQSPDKLALALRSLPADRLVIALRTLPADKLALALRSLSTDEVRQAMVTLFLADVDAWSKVSAFLNPPPNARAARTYSATWVDAAREKLRVKIRKEGYSPAALQEAEAILKQL